MLTHCFELKYKKERKKEAKEGKSKKLLPHHVFIRHDLGYYNTRFEISLEMCHALPKLKVNGRSISCSIPAMLPFAS